MHWLLNFRQWRIYHWWFNSAPRYITASSRPRRVRQQRPAVPDRTLSSLNGIQRRPTTTRKLSPKPWRSPKVASESTVESSRRRQNIPVRPRTCKQYTQLLLKAVERHNRERLKQQQRKDTERRWKSLQQDIDTTRLRKRRINRDLGDKERAEYHNLRSILRDQIAEQRLIYDELEKLQSDAKENASGTQDEDKIFEYWNWCMKTCKGKNGCIQITPALEDAFNDAVDSRKLINEASTYSVDTEARNSRTSHNRRETGSCENTEQSQWLADARHSLKSRRSRRFYQLLRMTLLQQRLMVPETAIPSETTKLRAPIEPKGIEGTSKSRQPLPDAVLQQYQHAAERYGMLMRYHDNFKSRNNIKDIAREYQQRDPNMTSEDFEAIVRYEHNRAVFNSDVALKHFLANREEAMKGGAEPIDPHTGRARPDYAEYAESILGDGAVSSLGTSAREQNRRCGERSAPKVWTWLDQCETCEHMDAFTSRALESLVDENGYQRLIDFTVKRKDTALEQELKSRRPTRDVKERLLMEHAVQSAEELRDDVRPWDTWSQQERVPYFRSRIDERPQTRD